MISPIFSDTTMSICLFIVSLTKCGCFLENASLMEGMVSLWIKVFQSLCKGRKGTVLFIQSNLELKKYCSMMIYIEETPRWHESYFLENLVKLHWSFSVLNLKNWFRRLKNTNSLTTASRETVFVLFHQRASSKCAPIYSSISSTMFLIFFCLKSWLVTKST